MVRKKRPTAVPILGQSFDIAYKEHLQEDGEDVYGQTDTKEFNIGIDKKSNKDPKTFEATLMHETIHGILGVSGLNELLDEKLEEAIVVAIENGLKHLYVRNY